MEYLLRHVAPDRLAEKREHLFTGRNVAAHTAIEFHWLDALYGEAHVLDQLTRAHLHYQESQRAAREQADLFRREGVERDWTEEAHADPFGPPPLHHFFQDPADDSVADQNNISVRGVDAL